jgi:hypothetical protein
MLAIAPPPDDPAHLFSGLMVTPGACSFLAAGTY